MHAQGEKAGGQSGEEGDEDQKRMARMQRNRESAMLSRQRKKMQLDELERQNKQLQATNTHLSGAPSPAQFCYVLLHPVIFTGLESQTVQEAQTCLTIYQALSGLVLGTACIACK